MTKRIKARDLWLPTLINQAAVYFIFMGMFIILLFILGNYQGFTPSTLVMLIVLIRLTQVFSAFGSLYAVISSMVMLRLNGRFKGGQIYLFILTFCLSMVSYFIFSVLEVLVEEI